ncbi:hypothetical protein D3C86_1248340 [compost metagenome]
MQVAHVLAVVANAVQIKVVAGVEAADAQAVEAGVSAAADVGNAAECSAQIIGAVIRDVSGFNRVDGLRHIPHRRAGTGCRIGFLDARVIGFHFGADGGGRQCGRGSVGKTGRQQGRKPKAIGRNTKRGRH